MKKIEKYEQIFINLVWSFLVIAFLLVLLADFDYIAENRAISEQTIHRFLFILSGGLLNFLKQIG